MHELRQAVLRYAARHANSDGLVHTPVDGLRMFRALAPSGPMHSLYHPLVCFILQGAKRMTVAGETHTFGAGQAVVVTVDAPVTGRVVQATRDAPYLAVSVAVLRELAAQMPLRTVADARGATLFAEDADAAALDCTMRLVRLLDRIDDAPLLQPGLVRELHYWLLCSRHGAVLRALALPESHAQRLADAIRLLRAEFRAPLRVDTLAAASHMSPTAFHRHFKATTSLTPGQFHKQLRLIEARRLMMDAGHPAGLAASKVGYASASQFSRDYARMFGAPPATHVRRLGGAARPDGDATVRVSS